MNKSNSIIGIETKRMMTEAEGCEYVGQGRTRFREWARQIGSRVQFGKSVRYDRQVIDRELDRLVEEAAADSADD